MRRMHGVSFLLAALALACGGSEPREIGSVSQAGRTPAAPSFTILASNDIGMHCACPGSSNFLLLPPYNTLRAQVIQRGSPPVSLSSSSTYRVTYSVLENSDAKLIADPYFSDWIQSSPKIFPGFQPVRADGAVQGLTGATLSGDMDAKSAGGAFFFEKAGIPAFPVVTGTASDIMTDPLGGPKRTPYLTGRIQVVERATGKVMSSDDVTVPVAFGGCCSCHLKVAKAYGYAAPTPQDSFKVMGLLHGKSTRIDFSYIDPDGDGKAGPIRCSWCHWDPAMGESKAPGLPAVWPGYRLLPGATFTKSDVRASQRTFSDVLHRFHAESSVVLSSYDADIGKNCYDCHPGNGVNCYRDTHTTKTNAAGQALWCTDCHGDLATRIAQNQMAQPWLDTTLPTCRQCHLTKSAEKNPGDRGWLGLGIFGKFLNSAGHKNTQILCSSCHGSPHGLNPSTLANDRSQNVALQGDPRPIGKCTVCHPSKSSTWSIPPH